ncbi:hypothetical protein C5167_029005 [Papaver somniferum]|nr:hypothetical protein C5167_029005 [Papaver somniferum]
MRDVDIRGDSNDATCHSSDNNRMKFPVILEGRRMRRKHRSRESPRAARKASLEMFLLFLRMRLLTLRKLIPSLRQRKFLPKGKKNAARSKAPQQYPSINLDDASVSHEEPQPTSPLEAPEDDGLFGKSSGYLSYGGTSSSSSQNRYLLDKRDFALNYAYANTEIVSKILNSPLQSLMIFPFLKYPMR